MSTTTATNTKADTDEIRREMAQIRMALHTHVQGLVAGTEAASRWTYYVRHYPWIAIGAAAAAGYMFAPRRRRHYSVTAAANKAAEAAVRKVVHEAGDAPLRTLSSGFHSKHKKETTRKAGLFGLAMGFAGPIAWRVAQTYATNQVVSFLAQRGMLGPSPFDQEMSQDPSSRPAPAGTPPAGSQPPWPY